MAFQALWLQNVDYPARLDRIVFDNLWSEGVLGSTALKVSARSIPSMAVDVAAGVGIVTGDDQSFQGKYVCREEATTSNVAISAAPGSGTRYDLVVLQVRDPNATGPAGDDARILVVVGTPSGSPVDPALPASCLPLARVRVPSGTAAITSGLIDDLRPQARLQGSSLPAGSIHEFAGAAAPAGYLLCDGSAVSQVDYAELFAAIGTTYNTSGGQAAPGAGLFRVPLLTGRVPVGKAAAGTFQTLGSTGGAETVTLATSEIPSHDHSITHDHPATTSSGQSQSHVHSVDVPAFTGGSGGQSVDHSHNIDPPNTGVTVVSAGAHSHGGSGADGVGDHTHSTIADTLASGTHGHQRISFFAAGSNQATGTANPVTNGAGAHGHTLTIASDGSHSHSASVDIAAFNSGGVSAGHSHTIDHDHGAFNSASASQDHTHSVDLPNFTGTSGTAGGGGSHANLQPYIVLNYIIKT